MPPIQLSDAQLSALSAFVIALNPETKPVFNSIPAFVAEGAVVYQNNRCALCHRLNGTGGLAGPALDMVGRRHDRVWLEKHFANPQSVSPGSSMPPFKLGSRATEALCDYLLALK
jgi:cbb3-type cytochrome oxidase cytochrome c subunit